MGIKQAQSVSAYSEHDDLRNVTISIEGLVPEGNDRFTLTNVKISMFPDCTDFIERLVGAGFDRRDVEDGFEAYAILLQNKQLAAIFAARCSNMSF